MKPLAKQIMHRLLLLITGHMAGYMIVGGIEGLDAWATVFYTIGFGVLVLSCLLLLLFDFEILESKMVVVIAALVPLGLAAGVIVSFFPQTRLLLAFLMFAGLILVLLSRTAMEGAAATILLASVHGIAGMALFLFPIIMHLVNRAPARFVLVGIGGALVGLGGLLLAFLKTGKGFLPKNLIYALFPWLLMAMTAAFVIGL